MTECTEMPLSLDFILLPIFTIVNKIRGKQPIKILVDLSLPCNVHTIPIANLGKKKT